MSCCTFLSVAKSHDLKTSDAGDKSITEVGLDEHTDWRDTPPVLENTKMMDALSTQKKNFNILYRRTCTLSRATSGTQLRRINQFGGELCRYNGTAGGARAKDQSDRQVRRSMSEK